MTPTVLWPSLSGITFLAAGVIAYRRDVRSASPSEGFGLVPLGPALVAAGLAAFAGEHFTIAAAIAALVPKWMPGRLFIAYVVGVAHLAAALSFVARRYVKWSSISLAVMFALFTLLMDVPSAMARPAPLAWMLAARQATFAMGALALFATVTLSESPQRTRTISMIARIWAGIVLVAYGVQHLLHPQLAPGVPSPVPTSAWVPFPQVIAYATGCLLVAFGVMMLVNRYGSTAAALSGVLMALLTVALYVPDFFLAANAQEQLKAINFTFDTLLFAGTMLVISKAISHTTSSPVAGRDGAD